MNPPNKPSEPKMDKAKCGDALNRTYERNEVRMAPNRPMELQDPSPIPLIDVGNALFLRLIKISVVFSYS